VTFVSHYIDDDVIARICCDISYHVECSRKIWSRDMYTICDNIAFMSNRIHDVSTKHSTCCDLSRHVLENYLITLNLIRPSTLAKLQTSHFCCNVLNYINVIARRIKYDAENSVRFIIKIQILNANY